MRKKYCILALLLLIAGCTASYRGPGSECPPVLIQRDYSRQVQLVNFRDEFEVELTGYEVYCYRDPSIKRRVAVITPQFRLRRLRPSDITRIDFDFYTETIKGPPGFLGKKTYPVSTDIAADAKSKAFGGRPVKVRIPYEGYEDFTVFIGLELSKAEYNYNSRAFDTERGYEELPADGTAAPLITRTVVIEEGYSEPVVVDSDTAVPAEKPASGCNSCALKSLFQ